MEMGYDFDDGRHGAGPLPRIGLFAGSAPGRGDAATDGAPARHPDWAGLRARFLAIHALHRTLADGVDARLPGGAFAQAGEAVLQACRPDGRRVNPLCSANGKVASAMIEAVAASPTPGDRGLQ